MVRRVSVVFLVWLWYSLLLGVGVGWCVCVSSGSAFQTDVSSNLQKNTMAFGTSSMIVTAI